MKEELPKRKNNRLQHYDYSSPGAYFITFCTHNRKNMLSRIVGAIHESPESQLTQYGKILDDVIKRFPAHLHTAVDKYVIMPNHIHIIFTITNDEVLRAIRESPLRVRSLLSKSVGYIKMNASKEIHKRYTSEKIWQRGFHDHVIRNRYDYERIVRYIYKNPLIWQYDCFYAKD
jgi:REP element-mobilizing transposase RayT